MIVSSHVGAHAHTLTKGMVVWMHWNRDARNMGSGSAKKKELVISKCISFSLHFITAFDTVQYERLHVEFYLSSYRAANLSWFPSRLFQLKGIACRNSFFFPFCSHSTILHALLRFTFRIFRLTSIRYFLNTRKCFARCKGVWRGQTTRQWKSERKKNKTFAIVIVEMKKKTTNRKKTTLTKHNKWNKINAHRIREL